MISNVIVDERHLTIFSRVQCK